LRAEWIALAKLYKVFLKFAKETVSGHRPATGQQQHTMRRHETHTEFGSQSTLNAAHTPQQSSLHHHSTTKLIIT